MEMKGDEQFVKTELWEGCIVWSIPCGCIDVRSIRRLPENQEIFMNEETGDSFLFDLMQNLDGKEEEDILTHWLEICDQNEADKVGDLVKFCVNGVSDPLRSESKIKKEVHCVHGLQSSAKGQCRVWVALVRLAQGFDSDIVISWNQVSFAEKSLDDSKETFKKILQSIEWKDIAFIKN